MGLKLDLLIEAINEIDNIDRKNMLINLSKIIKTYESKAQKLGFTIKYDTKIFDNESKNKERFISCSGTVDTNILLKPLFKNSKYDFEYFKLIYELANTIKNNLVTPYTLFINNEEIVISNIDYNRMPASTKIDYFYKHFIDPNNKYYSLIKINSNDISSKLSNNNINKYKEKVNINPNNDSIDQLCYNYLVNAKLLNNNTIYCEKEDTKIVAILFEYNSNGAITTKQLLTLTNIANLAAKYSSNIKIEYNKKEFVPNKEEREKFLKIIHILINQYKTKIKDIKVYKSFKFYNDNSDQNNYSDICDLCFIGKIDDDGEPKEYPDKESIKLMNELIGKINKILPKRYKVDIEDYRGYRLYFVDTYNK